MLAMDKQEKFVHPKDRVYNTQRETKCAHEMGYIEQYHHDYQNPSDDDEENLFIRDFVPTWSLIHGIVKRKAPAFNLEPDFRPDPVAQFMIENNLGV